MSADRHDAYLRRDQLGSGLARRALRGGAVSMLSQWATFVLRLASTAVLARLLTPDDYGLVAMVVAVTGMAQLVKDFGLSSATIQREEISNAQVNAMFWLNILVGLGLTAVVAAIAPLLAVFYGRPELTGISAALAASFAISGLAVQHQALLTRQMRYGRLAAVEVGSLCVGIAAALVAAALGAGYWALVAMQLAMPTAQSAALWLACRWRPGRPRGAEGLRSLVVFGSQLSAFNVLNYLSRNLDNVLIGRFVGASSLGLYARAYQLLLLPIQQIDRPIARVAIPTLSYLQNDPVRFRRYYTKAIGGIALMALPAIALAGGLAEEIVLVMLGEQWLEAAPIFRVLAFAGLVQVVAHTTGWLYVSLGRTDRQLVWGLASRPVVLVAFFVGIQWGAYGVAVAYTIVEYLLVIPLFAWAVRGSPVRLADIGRAMWRPLLLSGAVYVSSVAIRTELESVGTFAQIAGAAGAAIGLCGFVVIVSKATRAQIAVLARAR